MYLENKARKIQAILQETCILCIDMWDEHVAIKVPKQLKKRMKTRRVNWSQELRDAIELKLDSENQKQAVEELDSVLSSVKPGFDPSRAIKEARRRG